MKPVLQMEQPQGFAEGVLPEGIRSRLVGANGLRMHVLEAGHETPGRPCVLLLHGFPELALSWRSNMLPLAQAGFHVIAPDQRGYGRTTGWENSYDCELDRFGMRNLVTDALHLVHAFGHRKVHGVVGHDYGSPVAAYAALIRPDVFQRVVLMAGPFPGAPKAPFDTADTAATQTQDPVHEELAALGRKHYQWYYATREANTDMRRPTQGLQAFLRAYFHHKSADWAPNRPHRLGGWVASELAKMPTYYIMEKDGDMPANVAPFMPSAEEIRANAWLPEHVLEAYTAEYARTGFQGGLNWYRCDTGGLNAREMRLFGGRTIDVPSMFIAGLSDWGVYQKPGHLEAMVQEACTDLRGCHLLSGAGHWVQQEQPAATNELLLRFLG